MRIDRLLGITLMLLNKRNVTARELAGRFEVSTRTIYRDIDDLSAAGVPVFANKGNSGGISLLENFVLSRSMLTEHERDSLLLALKTLQSTRYPEIDSILEKIGAVFNNVEAADWVHIEFSPWGSGANEENKFLDLKRAILERRITAFDYLNSDGILSHRETEPLYLIFKSHAWYIWAYCKMRRDFRLFRVSRMRNPVVTDEVFVRRIPDKSDIEGPQAAGPPKPLVTLKLRFQARDLFRVYDDFDQDKITRNPDGSCDASMTFPEDEWVYGYILSFGSFVEVLEPPHIREIIRQRLQNALRYYQPPKYDNLLSDSSAKIKANEKEVGTMDVKYVIKGDKGKTCADCSLFKDKGDGMGDCYGHEVLAAGSCNMFIPKNKN
jgi:predicted DNA-binding transcriptional regulator YafY